MKNTVQNLRNIAETLDSVHWQAIEELEELRDALCFEDWEILVSFVEEVRPVLLMDLNKELVEEHRPQLIVQHQDWMEWNDMDIPFKKNRNFKNTFGCSFFFPFRSPNGVRNSTGIPLQPF